MDESRTINSFDVIHTQRKSLQIFRKQQKLKLK